MQGPPQFQVNAFVGTADGARTIRAALWFCFFVCIGIFDARPACAVRVFSFVRPLQSPAGGPQDAYTVPRFLPSQGR